MNNAVVARRAAQEPAFRTLPQLLPRFLLVLSLILITVRLVPTVGMVVSVGAALYALRGSRQVVEALTVLAFLLLLGNADVSLTRWLVLFAAFGRVVWDTFVSDAPLPSIVWHLLVFFATILVFSLVASWAPLISILKLVSFTIGVGAAMTAFYRTPDLRDYWLDWFFTLGMFMLYASLPLYATGGGYERNSSGFQGILSHPQTFGPVIAPVAALLSGLVLFGGDRRWYVVLGAVLAWVGLFMSASRTSLLATVLGFGIALGAGLLAGRRLRFDVAAILLRPTTLYFLLVAIGLAILQWGQVQEKITSFLVKDDSEIGSVAESLESSRGELIRRSLQNFQNAPVTGIGFGVPSDATLLDRQATGFLGLPIAASVEKGFMPSAVLEETGLAGAILVVMLIATLFWPIVSGGYITFCWMLGACLMVNFGEMVFFSLGGMGLYFWLCMCFVYMYAATQERETQEADQIRRT